MALQQKMIDEGNWLFRHRSAIPAVLYLFAVIVLWLEPERNYLLPSQDWAGLICLAVSLAGVVVRAHVVGYKPANTSGRNTSGQLAEALNSTGLYSLVRHPLYVGNFLMWLGLILYVGNIWFCLVSCLLYWIYYERIMLAEESFLREKFGEAYISWAKQVPSFIPRFTGFQKPPLPFSFITVLKREYSGFFGIFFTFLLLNFLKYFFQFRELNVGMLWVILFGIATVVAITLKILKKKSLLDVEGR
ncbi:MAG: DUF1295 domain-containing protein [Bacteroidetes bacterium]|nr:DUF1295 domain-containing protein [Bacteroidota bacterium]